MTKSEEDSALMARIATFVSSVKTHIENIHNISVDRNPKRYKKILYVSVLEGIAKVRYPSKEPRDRLIKLVHTFGGWNDGERISLPHLVAALERTADERFEDIRKYAYSQLHNWDHGVPLYLDNDPMFSEIQKRWPKEEGSDLRIDCLRIELKRLRHVELLYEYRNYLVHESRQPTMGFEEADDIHPFYESVNEHSTVFGGKAPEWHLVYTSGFLDQLCRTCLGSLEQYLKKNKKDPYSTFRDGWYVVEQFNHDVRFPVLKPFYSDSRDDP